MSSPESYGNGRAELQKVFLGWLMETSLILSLISMNFNGLYVLPLKKPTDMTNKGRGTHCSLIVSHLWAQAALSHGWQRELMVDGKFMTTLGR